MTKGGKQYSYQCPTQEIPAWI